MAILLFVYGMGLKGSLSSNDPNWGALLSSISSPEAGGGILLPEIWCFSQAFLALFQDPVLAL